MLRFPRTLPRGQRALLQTLNEQAQRGESSGFHITKRKGDQIWYKHISPTMEREGEYVTLFAHLQVLASAHYIDLRETTFNLPQRP